MPEAEASANQATENRRSLSSFLSTAVDYISMHRPRLGAWHRVKTSTAKQIRVTYMCTFDLEMAWDETFCPLILIFSSPHYGRKLSAAKRVLNVEIHITLILNSAYLKFGLFGFLRSADLKFGLFGFFFFSRNSVFLLQHFSQNSVFFNQF